MEIKCAQTDKAARLQQEDCASLKADDRRLPVINALNGLYASVSWDYLHGVDPIKHDLAEIEWHFYFSLALILRSLDYKTLSGILNDDEGFLARMGRMDFTTPNAFLVNTIKNEEVA